MELALALHQNDPSIDVVISGSTIVLDDGSLVDGATEDVDQKLRRHLHARAIQKGLQKPPALGVDAAWSRPNL